MRVIVIGLDCAPPSLVFDRWAPHLPNLSALRARGLWGPLRSCMPPITVPAWTCMVSGRDAGELGIYGFRNRSRGYDLRIATSRDVQAKRVWDRLGEHGHSVCTLFVPLTSPPMPVRGTQVSCFLHSDGPYVSPPQRQSELEARHGVLQADADSFRDGDLRRIVDEIRTMTTQHFAITRDLWERDRPDFLMMVAMGPDRLHHALWHHLDPEAPRYVAGNPWEAEALAYYQQLDDEVGRVMTLLSDDDVIMVVSDHGARAMQGAVAINEWLIREGWLGLKERPTKPTPLREVVDWSRTKAWGEGGYYARVWLNVRGREPEGIVDPSRIEAERETLRRALLEVVPGTTAQTPEALFHEQRGEPPDLFVVFGDLAYRSVGTVGHPDVMLAGDGEDGCNHAWDGIFIMAGPDTESKRIEAEIYDVGRTILGHFDVPAGDWRGRDWSTS